jgi:hypothetical protein
MLTQAYLADAVSSPRRVDDILRARRLAEMAPTVTNELHAYARYLRRNGRLSTAHSVDFLIAQLEGRV